ncbi:MAG: O-antigen ligase family protein [Firmicutes bacterium]|jgi:O-antigen ligase|nr:O-antigen ligase family protein [Bacillota bacterium]
MYNKIKLIPIIIFSAMVPLIMRLKPYAIPQEMFEVYKNTRIHSDFYSYYKMMWIIIAAVLALIVLLKYFNKEKFLKNFKSKINILLLILMVFIIVSSIMSPYKSIVIFGFVDRFEGMLVQLAYITMVLYINNFIEDKSDIKCIVKCIIISSGILGIMGILEFYGHNILATNIGRKLILPLSLHDKLGVINFSIKDKSISSTLYNPNFVGSYMVMTTFLGLSMLFKAVNIKEKFLYGAYTLLMFFNLVGCNSAAGRVGYFGAFALMLIILNKKIVFRKDIAASLLLAIVLIFVAPSVMGISGVVDEVIKNEADVSSAVTSSDKYNSKFEFSKDNVIMNFDGRDVEVKIKGSIVNFYVDGEKMKYDIEKDTRRIVLRDDSLSKYQFVLSKEKNAIAVKYDTFSYILYLTKDGFQLYDQYKRPLKYEVVDEFKPLIGLEKIGSSRGYLWKTSIPLMKDSLIIGSGPDTFAAVFPQHDLLGKYKFLSTSYAYVDKPHNTYIQIGVQTGVVSLLVYLGILVIYGFKSFRLYFKGVENDLYYYGVGMLCAVFGYSVTALFNDSNVSVAPMFWTILGLGVVINKIYENSISEEF